MQTKMPSIGAESEQGRCRDVDMRDRNGTRRFTSNVLWNLDVLLSQLDKGVS